MIRPTPNNLSIKFAISVALTGCVGSYIDRRYFNLTRVADDFTKKIGHLGTFVIAFVANSSVFRGGLHWMLKSERSEETHLKKYQDFYKMYVSFSCLLSFVIAFDKNSDLYEFYQSKTTIFKVNHIATQHLVFLATDRIVESIFFLPGFYYRGTQHIKGSNLRSLPENFRVERNLYIDECQNLTTLPEQLNVSGGLYIRNCTCFIEIPKGLSVGQNLVIAKCDNLTTIPEDLYVRDLFSIKECRNLNTLPGGIDVGILFIDKCENLTTLPEGLTIAANLDIRDCINLTILPENFKVGGHLYLQGCTSLTSLPDCISRLGPCENGQTRIIDLTRTGIPEEILNTLRNDHSPGMRFLT